MICVKVYFQVFCTVHLRLHIAFNLLGFKWQRSQQMFLRFTFFYEGASMYFVLVLSLDYDASKILPSYPLFCSILLFLQLLLGAPLWSPSPESGRPLSHSHLADSSASWRPSGTTHMKLLTTGFSTTYRSLFLQEVIFLYECWFFYQIISSVKILGLHVYGSSLHFWITVVIKYYTGTKALL